MRAYIVMPWILAAAALAGCASRPINEPITQFDPKTGYRPYLIIPKRQNNDPQTLFVLSFSGGGTRAAAFSYGVLEELRRTEIVADGQRRRLIDEVDTITGVSGGSFTALAYALHGEKLFAEYEQRFLKRDVEGELLARTLNPFNWWRFIGGSAGRSELAADFYDEILFEGATFGDLLDKPGPAAIATATDISTGSRLAFFQNDFDLLCSDLGKVRLSRAAATSSAVPVVLSATTFNNYGGTCGYKYPAWVAVVANPDPDKRVRPSGRAYQRYLEMKEFQDSANRPYIHLVDGGVADNLGVRGVLETLEELAVSSEFRGEIGFGGIRRIVLIVVNARSSPRTDWNLVESPPGMVSQLLQSTSVPIDRYSFETVEMMKDRAEITKWRRELLIAQARLAGATEAQAEARVPKVSLEVLDVSFDALQDPKERAYFMDLPTSFVLPAEAIDRLREVAGKLLRQSEEYQAIVRELGGKPAK
jgi:NTE family protein